MSDLAKEIVWEEEEGENVTECRALNCLRVALLAAKTSASV